ncbi:hypothetical protein [Nitrincola sp. MINF-07-Sa-05]|uniref:hypothetical protein n=1 Tax=Nitrincola salilacus TaxID=3400273 RepID=UPI003917F22B
MNIKIKDYLLLMLTLSLAGCMNFSLDPTMIGTSKSSAINSGLQLAIFDRRHELCPDMNRTNTKAGVDVFRQQVETVYFHTHVYHTYYKDSYDKSMRLSTADLWDVVAPDIRINRTKWCLNTEDILIKEGAYLYR